MDCCFHESMQDRGAAECRQSGADLHGGMQRDARMTVRLVDRHQRQQTPHDGCGQRRPVHPLRPRQAQRGGLHAPLVPAWQAAHQQRCCIHGFLQHRRQRGAQAGAWMREALPGNFCQRQARDNGGKQRLRPAAAAGQQGCQRDQWRQGTISEQALGCRSPPAVQRKSQRRQSYAVFHQSRARLGGQQLAQARHMVPIRCRMGGRAAIGGCR
ncbi:hypothetical protein ABPG75_009187 [Micractinium tetrahymenae]